MPGSHMLPGYYSMRRSFLPDSDLCHTMKQYSSDTYTSTLGSKAFSYEHPSTYPSFIDSYYTPESYGEYRGPASYTSSGGSLFPTPTLPALLPTLSGESSPQLLLVRDPWDQPSEDAVSQSEVMCPDAPAPVADSPSLGGADSGSSSPYRLSSGRNGTSIPSSSQYTLQTLEDVPYQATSYTSASSYSCPSYLATPGDLVKMTPVTSEEPSSAAVSLSDTTSWAKDDGTGSWLNATKLNTFNLGQRNKASSLTMDKYHILEVIGEGSFGRVYKGRKKFSGQVVALKFIPKVGRSEKDLRSLRREIDIMRGLKHPNIVLLLDSFETEREVVVVTEYAEGELFQILEDDGSLPESQVREIACQLVSALYYLHSHRILHRDMKPQNILLGKGGVVKLCDFGFARAMSMSTLVLTSIKGTPLYMSPELVEEKPYDHSADLWSLGCILYELHTGAPPFYTNSIFQLVQLIVRDPIKWPDNMSPHCLSFLKGLLMKDPDKRLSWPDLLHHPFVADGVLIVSGEARNNPLTAPASPCLQALKQQQAAEKSSARSGEGKLLRKAREMREKEKIHRQKAGSTRTARGSEMRRPTASARGAPTTGHSLGSTFSVYQNSSQPAANQQQANDIGVTRVRSAPHKGQISRDYEREFPSVEVGPRQLLKPPVLGRMSLASVRMDSEEQDDDGETECKWLTEQSHQAPMNNSVLQKLKPALVSAKNKLSSGKDEEISSILQPLKLLRNIVVKCPNVDAEMVGKELDLPHLLFGMIEDILSIPEKIQEPEGELVLCDLMSVLIIYLEKCPNWETKERRAEDLSQLFISVFLSRDPKRSAILATAILTLISRGGLPVNVTVEKLTRFLGNILTDTAEVENPLPSGWGMCDGLLYLILHKLSESGSNSPSDFLDCELWPCLWNKVNSTLENRESHNSYFSLNGLYALLSLITALIERGLFWGDSEIKSLSVMSCHLLCIPFTLDLPLENLVSVLRLYESSNIMTALVQMIQTVPIALVELPMCLLNHLLLSDPQHTTSALICATQASAFLQNNPEHSNNRSDLAHDQLSGSRNGVERNKYAAITKKTKTERITSKNGLKGNMDASEIKNTPLTSQISRRNDLHQSIKEVQQKTKIHSPERIMEHLRLLRSGCVEELMDSLEILGCSSERLQNRSRISSIVDSLEDFRGSGVHPELSIRSSPEEVRTAGTLLALLLQSEALCSCAVELLNLLSQIIRHPSFQPFFTPPVEISILRLALQHRDDGVRAASCGLLAHFGPSIRVIIDESKFAVFQDLLGCLRDPAPSVRRRACWAVGKWLCVMGNTNNRYKNRAGMSELSVRDGLKRVDVGRDSEGDLWMQRAIEAACPLASLLSDTDHRIRQLCCEALADLASLSQAHGALVDADAPCLILQVVCNDSHHAVRQAAVATLHVFSQQNTLLQVLMSLGAGRKLARSFQSFVFQKDYQWLVSKLDGAVDGKT
ncbi:hypothetical protein DNTS_006537 [Danionella cerebrum]|uniref:non-specific serine/threonine protein kinase n=1 Tax=Danionella cerebrum TaxID=2873325 RepID=A0A553Q201_9TELE|nr:hypothetical protein DNTS_006537 [Danionella translucida]